MKEDTVIEIYNSLINYFSVYTYFKINFNKNNLKAIEDIEKEFSTYPASFVQMAKVKLYEQMHAMEKPINEEKQIVKDFLKSTPMLIINFK